MTLPLLINGTPVAPGPRYTRPAEPPKPRVFDNLDGAPPEQDRHFSRVARRMRSSEWWFRYAPEPVREQYPRHPQGSNHPAPVSGEINT